MPSSRMPDLNSGPQAEAMNAISNADITDEQKRLAWTVLNRVRAGDDVAAIIELVRSIGQAQGAAGELEKLLTDLLIAPATLHHVERLQIVPGARPCCLVRIGQQFRELPIHPDVDVAQIEGLKPWEFVRVNSKEMVITGVWRDDPDLWSRLQGDVVDYQSALDENHPELAVINRPGRGDEVVRLAPDLCDAQLTTGDQLVLQRDNDQWAIGQIPKDNAQCEYEIPISDLKFGLSDLAGLEGVAERLFGHILPRVIFPEARRQFDLDPMNGFLVHSTKPGQGKTALLRAAVHDLHQMGQRHDFDVALFLVPPTALKSKWHGEDGRLVRKLGGSVRARCARQNGRRLLLFLGFDEVESLGSRMSAEQGLISTAQNDVCQALLNEMDGVLQSATGDGVRSEVLWVGLTNRLDMLDPALRRPDRFGNLVVEMPDYDAAAAESILWVYCRKASICWQIGDEAQANAPEEVVRRQILRPAVAQVFDKPALFYLTEGRRRTNVSAQQVLAGVHFKNAMTKAKERAALRSIRGSARRPSAPTT